MECNPCQHQGGRHAQAFKIKNNISIPLLLESPRHYLFSSTKKSASGGRGFQALTLFLIYTFAAATHGFIISVTAVHLQFSGMFYRHMS